MLGRLVDRAAWLPARVLMQGFMRRAGIGNTQTLARGYNRLRYAARRRLHLREYERFDELLAEHGQLDAAHPPVEMRDGWAMDTRGVLPHLQQLLDDTAPLIADRGGVKHTHAQQPYFRSLLAPGDVQDNPSFLELIVSAPVLATVGHYMRMVPVLSKTRPPPIRFMESNQALDPRGSAPFEESQLFHRDLHDAPVVYVLVALQDITEECGPWHFLPRSVSLRASRELGYRRRGVPYRISDEAMFSVVDESEVVRFVGPRGSVLFIDSGACFHYGSRNSMVPRYQMMYAFTTPCRTDLSQVFEAERSFPVQSTDSRLRQLVLE